MTELNGTVSPAFEPVRDTVEAQLRSGAEVGLSLVVDLDGRQVVDLWAGHRDAARTQPWRRDTITNVWSITKTVTSLAALLLVDAGDLEVHALLARVRSKRQATCRSTAPAVTHLGCVRPRPPRPA